MEGKKQKSKRIEKIVPLSVKAASVEWVSSNPNDGRTIVRCNYGNVSVTESVEEVTALVNDALKQIRLDEHPRSTVNNPTYHFNHAQLGLQDGLTGQQITPEPSQTAPRGNDHGEKMSIGV